MAWRHTPDGYFYQPRKFPPGPALNVRACKLSIEVAASIPHYALTALIFHDEFLMTFVEFLGLLCLNCHGSDNGTVLKVPPLEMDEWIEYFYYRGFSGCHLSRSSGRRLERASTLRDETKTVPSGTVQTNGNVRRAGDRDMTQSS